MVKHQLFLWWPALQSETTMIRTTFWSVFGVLMTFFSLRRNVGERNWNDLEDIVGCVSKGRERNFNIFRLWRKHKHFARYREAKM